MSPKVRCLLDDLRALSTQDVSGLSGMEANDLYIALQLATVSVDAAQVVAGNFDWKDERSRKFGRINTETAAANAQVEDQLLSCLKAIVHEYDNTYDASIEPGDSHWTAAASIPVEVMQHAERLIKKHG